MLAGGFGWTGTAVVLEPGTAVGFAAGGLTTVVVLFESAGIIIFCVSPGSTFASVVATGASAAGVGAVTSAGASSALPCKTETLPLKAGIDIISAEIMNKAAAPIVNFESTDAVPRGEKAVLETLLVNNAPASVLPGCSKTEPISTTHDIKNKAYKM